MKIKKIKEKNCKLNINHRKKIEFELYFILWFEGVLEWNHKKHDFYRISPKERSPIWSAAKPLTWCWETKITTNLNLSRIILFLFFLQMRIVSHKKTDTFTRFGWPTWPFVDFAVVAIIDVEHGQQMMFSGWFGQCHYLKCWMFVPVQWSSWCRGEPFWLLVAPHFRRIRFDHFRRSMQIESISSLQCQPHQTYRRPDRKRNKQKDNKKPVNYLNGTTEENVNQATNQIG